MTKYDPMRKVSVEQRYQLVQIYLHMGMAEARTACLEAGVDQCYAEKQAAEMGLYQHRKATGGRIDDKHNLPSYKVDHEDPRWARAIKVGKVVA